MQQQQLLRPKPAFGKAFQEEARKLVPVYRVSSLVGKPATPAPTENSSPVCYAHLKNFREGFEPDF